MVDLYAIYDVNSSSTFMEEYKSNSGFILIGLEEQTFRAVNAPIINSINDWAKNIDDKNPESKTG